MYQGHYRRTIHPTRLQRSIKMNPEQEEIISTLKKVWILNPNLRLGQLIESITECRCIFHITDADWLSSLKERYDETSRNTSITSS